MATPEEIQKLKEEQRRRIAEKEAAGVQVGGAGMAGEPGEVVKRGDVGITPTGATVFGAKKDEKLQSVAQQPVTQPARKGDGAAEFLKEKEFSQEQIPQRTELDIEREGIEKVPILGPAVAAVEDILVKNSAEGGLFEEEFREFASNNVDEPLIANPETAREFALQKIQKDTIKQGLSSSEEFGAVIEAIPIVGAAARFFASGLIESPKSNVDTLLTEIDSERERASVLAEKAMTGKLSDPFLAYNQIEDIEDNIIRLETRIKLLSQTSAVLIADADELNRIEEKILRSKERVFIAKQAAAGGLVAPASNTNLFLTLKELENES